MQSTSSSFGDQLRAHLAKQIADGEIEPPCDEWLIETPEDEDLMDYIQDK